MLLLLVIVIVIIFIIINVNYIYSIVIISIVIIVIIIVVIVIVFIIMYWFPGQNIRHPGCEVGIAYFVNKNKLLLNYYTLIETSTGMNFDNNCEPCYICLCGWAIDFLAKTLPH